MADQHQLALLRYQPGAWSTWRKQHPEIGPDLREADLRGADLSETNLSRVDFEGADLSETNLTSSDLRGAVLRHANLGNATLQDARLNETILDGILLRGANLWGADFSGQHWVNLNGADLSKTILMEANLSRANLGGTNLREANLAYSNLNSAYLSRANLQGANLQGANLSGADLTEADLSEAKVGRTIFGDIDLRLAKGLETMIHENPSFLSTSTLERSEGDLPEVFLRGVGLSDTFISYARSLVQFPIQYSTCFISYSSKDKMLAHRLHNDLQAHGVRCWFAPEDMKIGNKIRDHIDQAIQIHDRSLLLLSEHSIASTWVEHEVEAVLEKEDRQKREILFPVRLDEAIMHTSKAWAATLRRTRHIGDFTRWKDHDAYQQTFERLLRDLKKADEPHNQETKQ
ncbi:MAG TPA: toll/interleukin-1 receptor domain-containing protein [Ktedonobacteraceae bacterium]|nr:toll/interleukin-1 receptor domain-containing protein [Ktedonobacteraceae bacterium]